MTSLKTLRTRLLQAEVALHRLATGELEVHVSVGGYGGTTYTPANLDQLRAYITQLKTQIAAKQNKPRRGTLFVRF